MSLTWKQMTPIKIPCYVEKFAKDIPYTLEITMDDTLIFTETKSGESFALDHEAASKSVYVESDKIDCMHRRCPAQTFSLSPSRNPQYQLDICKLIAWLEYPDASQEQLLPIMDHLIRERNCHLTEDGYTMPLFFLCLFLCVIYSFAAVGQHWYIPFFLCCTIIVAVLTFWWRISTQTQSAGWTIWPCIILYTSYCLIFLPMLFVFSLPKMFSVVFVFYFSFRSAVDYITMLFRIPKMKKLFMEEGF